MDAMLFGLLLLVGLSVGFLSGLLGIGGGIVMFPLLLYLPPLLRLPEIGIKNITGLTMVQGFFAALTAMLYYHKNALVNKSLVLTLGVSIFLSSLSGAFTSKAVDDRILLVVFGALAVLAAIMMLIPRSYSRDELTEEHVEYGKSAAIVIGIVLGFSIGLVGQGGAFILIPTLLYILKIPLRVALGSTLAIGLFSSSAGLVGKIATGQVPYLMAVPLVAGAIPAARWGSMVGKKTNVQILRWLLAAIICATAIKVWLDIL